MRTQVLTPPADGSSIRWRSRKPVSDPCYDLLIVGTGMTGMAAALFAADRDLDTVQVGLAGELQFASGLLDLLGVHPVETGHVWENPWEGIRHLVKDRPEHPYAHLKTDLIRRSLTVFTQFMSDAGHPYHMEPDRNLQVITPVGTVKTTYAVPCSMIKGVHAHAAGKPCLLVGFDGLNGWSSRQIKETLGDAWPGLRALSIPFPGMHGELLGEHMARAMERPEILRAIAGTVRKHLRNEEAVGFPAVLGITASAKVVADLETELALPVFELPTMLPGVTGIRIREAFVENLPGKGIRMHNHSKISAVEKTGDGLFRAHVGAVNPAWSILARTILLAGGRFLGKGLHTERDRICESLFDLPVHQPEGPVSWHRQELFHKSGHPINRAGIMVDHDFRPVDANGRIIHPNLYAAGSILAHQDWIREKCGSGLAIATAYGAIRACRHFLNT